MNEEEAVIKHKEDPLAPEAYLIWNVLEEREVYKAEFS